MASFTDGLVSGDEAKKVFNLRSKSVDEKTVSAASEAALSTKVNGEEQDGWTAAKWNKKSVRVTKPKPTDRQLEDDVWTLLYRLGFKELNADRNFTIKLGPHSPARQLDVFAKDDETVFIVECTHAQDQKAKSIKVLIDKINGIRDEVIKAVHSHYGKEPKLKVKWAIATRNVDWRKADWQRAAEAKIGVITEHELAYYSKLTSYLKQAARYQFLAHYLKGEGVDGLKTVVPATTGKMGGTTFYNFLISPYDLLKIAYISHKADNDFETYQRMVKQKRLKEIATYIDNGGQFPTNIVINVKANNSLRFEKIQNFENCTFGTLTLPGQYGSAWVIDGQHRLYGFAFAERGKNHVVPVLAYENLPPEKEIQLFLDINCEQVGVPRNLTKELLSNLDHGSDDPAKRLTAQYPRIALRLDEMADSPIRDRVLTVSKDKDSNRCLTLTSLADGIEENRFLGSITQTKPNPPVILAGPLCELSGDIDLTTEKAADVIAGYFDLFAKGVPANWQLGDAKGGFLCTNNGLRALLRLLKELITHFESRDHVEAVSMDAGEIVKKVTPYAAPLVEYFRNADPDEIQRFRTGKSSLDGVKKNCLGMMGIINAAIPSFNSPELAEYQNSRDKEGTTEAARLVLEINAILHKDVIDTLKAEYGNRWFFEGVPPQIRSKCLELMNAEGGVKEMHQYLFLIDYQAIVLKNFQLFEKRYLLFGDAKAAKADKVSWISKLNSIRTTTAHPEKGLISKDEVAFVRKVYALVKEKLLPIQHSSTVHAQLIY